MWYKTRNNTLKILPKPEQETNTMNFITTTKPKNQPFITSKILQWLWMSANQDIDVEAFKWLDLLVKKFETTKKLYFSYNAQFKACDKRYNDMSIYILFAEILVIFYGYNKKVLYLNCFLKVMDTLCASLSFLSINQKKKVAGLIKKETVLIENLIKSTL